MIGKRIFFALLIGLLLLTAGCVQQEEAPQENNGVQGSSTVVLTVKYLDAEGNTIAEKAISTPKGVNAWILMKDNMDVDFEEFSFGPMVKGIEGTPSPEGHYLALYVNGEYATQGVNGYFIQEDTLMEWKTEAIDSFGLE
ncbi:MAG: hypothetical protein CL943_04100 [Candidatus Diapherotrites archaeon]|uniref:Transcobalamin-like C-terminal domain-containing protein n=1 Tax=Candidatus Iainarchaeum sp. TaxID=3101447 RepID=A0A2D6M213_9ARCH|nr:hypothetical protein [Candidatus Diapherotrites archaeon]